MTVRGRDATLMVAVAAAMWGLDGLLRKPLATHLDAGTVVLWEHLIVVCVLAPRLAAALRAFRSCEWRYRIAIIVIGVGASAIATALFTRSFALAARSNDFVTPLVLQKLQPLIAVALAVLLLGERAHAAYATFLVLAMASAWLMTFAHPLHASVAELEPALFALGAAALWAAGTVLGRFVGTRIEPGELMTLRFIFGLVAAAGVVLGTDAPIAPGWHNLMGLTLLAMIPGLLAIMIYYRALRHTPAARATIAELAFPATAAVVGVTFLKTQLSPSQWLGLVLLLLTICALGWHESQRRAAVEAGSRHLARKPEATSTGQGL